MNTKLKCILLDDELPGLTYLKMLCEQLPELEVVKAFNSPNKFLAELHNLEFQLCILDIQMSEMNGLQVANMLKGKMVIFTTAYKEYAADAFDLDAIDYVRKPVQKQRLHDAITKALDRHSNKNVAKDVLHLNTDKGKMLVPFNQLGYIKASEVDSRDKIAILLNGSSLTFKNISFESLLKLLPPTQFCRINKREVISIKIVHTYSFKEITTSLHFDATQPVKLTLSESYRHAFFKVVKVNL